MAFQTSFDSIESTRIALLKLEHCCADCDQTAVASMRHMYLKALAQLEATLAILQNQALFGPTGIAHHPSSDELETLEEDNDRLV
jgi:hypothetical protein